MARELPYFKFEPLAFMSGDINLERWELQGIFYNICAFYWSKDCNVSLTVIGKKYAGSEPLIEELINLGIMDVDDDFISISFLNEQWTSKETQKQINIINGKKGGRPKKQNETENKPNGFSFANQNDNRNETHIEYNKSKVEVEVNTEDLGFEDFTLLDEDLKEKKSELINLICEKYGYVEMRFANKQKLVMAYVSTVIKSIEDYDYFIDNVNCYIEYKKLSEEKHHGFDGLYGTQAERFEDGALQKENWRQKLINHQLYQKPKSTFEKTNDVFEQLKDLKRKQRNGNTEV